jgi:hypothetical protein
MHMSPLRMATEAHALRQVKNLATGGGAQSSLAETVDRSGDGLLPALLAGVRPGGRVTLVPA